MLSEEVNKEEVKKGRYCRKRKIVLENTASSGSSPSTIASALGYLIIFAIISISVVVRRSRGVVGGRDDLSYGCDGLISGNDGLGQNGSSDQTLGGSGGFDLSGWSGDQSSGLHDGCWSHRKGSNDWSENGGGLGDVAGLHGGGDDATGLGGGDYGSGVSGGADGASVGTDDGGLCRWAFEHCPFGWGAYQSHGHRGVGEVAGGGYRRGDEEDCEGLEEVKIHY